MKIDVEKDCFSKINSPGHRVINSKGEIGFQESEAFFTQKQRLEDEGIVFVKNHVIDLKTYQFYLLKQMKTSYNSMYLDLLSFFIKSRLL